MISILEFLVKKHQTTTVEDVFDKLSKLKYNPFQTRSNKHLSFTALSHWVKSKDDQWVRSSDSSDFSSNENMLKYMKSFYKDGEYLYFAFTQYLVLSLEDTSHYAKSKTYEKIIQSYDLEYDIEGAGYASNDKEIYIHIKNFDEDLPKLYNLLNDNKLKEILK